MNREIHVRFWEGLGVRFPRATHSRAANTSEIAFGRLVSLETVVVPCLDTCLEIYGAIKESALKTSTYGA